MENKKLTRIGVLVNIDLDNGEHTFQKRFGWDVNNDRDVSNNKDEFVNDLIEYIKDNIFKYS